MYQIVEEYNASEDEVQALEASQSDQLWSHGFRIPNPWGEGMVGVWFSFCEGSD